MISDSRCDFRIWATKSLRNCIRLSEFNHRAALYGASYDDLLSLFDSRKRIVYDGWTWKLHRTYVSEIKDYVLSLGREGCHPFHEFLISWVVDFYADRGLLPVSRLMSSGYDLDYGFFRLEVETGYKETYHALERLLERSDVPVGIVVPNASVARRYRAYFGHSAYRIFSFRYKYLDNISKLAFF